MPELIKKGVIWIAVLALLMILTFIFRKPLWEILTSFFTLLSDREKVKSIINAFGWGAPLAFIGVQVLQVLLAPIPGEASGFIGGYLFGLWPGFLFSTIGLTIGSWINFIVGRFLGKRYIRQLIPEKQLDRFDKMANPKGTLVLFLLFIFPGFPKDYLCLFVGMSTLSLKVFMVLAAFGRIPGTLILSVQGAYLYEKNYGVVIISMLICLLIGFLAYYYREAFYRWMERLNGKVPKP